MGNVIRDKRRGFTVVAGDLLYVRRDPKTPLTAWGITLAKWAIIIEYLAEHEYLLGNLGVDTCGLCMLYWEKGENDGYGACECCPVAQKVGRGYCKNTPFETFEDAIGIGRNLRAAKAFRRWLLRLAQENGYDTSEVE